MARPSKYTPATVKKITDALSAGNTRRAAAAYAGIDVRTMERWARRYAAFAASLLQVEAACEVGHVAAITKAARDGDWKASAWWLERRRHADWGKVDRLEIEITETAARVAAQTGADPDWLIKRAVELVEQARASADE
jgi:hypothetical protein